MFIRSYTVGLVPVAVMLAGFGLGVERASAQASYEFSATYNTVVTIDPSYRPDLGIFRATITGENTDAPYGLTNFTSNTYGRFDPTTNISTFNANPAVFGLQGEPILSDRYYGGSNELFGTASDMAKFDFEQGTVSGSGTITLTGGTGLFENATGEITFTQNDRLTSTNLTDPFEGKATLNFSVQTPQAVPEPSTNATLVGASVIGFGLLLRRHRRKSAMSNLINRGD
jgi:hypothetical protein